MFKKFFSFNWLKNLFSRKKNENEMLVTPPTTEQVPTLPKQEEKAPTTHIYFATMREVYEFLKRKNKNKELLEKFKQMEEDARECAYCKEQMKKMDKGDHEGAYKKLERYEKQNKEMQKELKELKEKYSQQTRDENKAGSAQGYEKINAQQVGEKLTKFDEIENIIQKRWKEKRQSSHSFEDLELVIQQLDITFGLNKGLENMLDSELAKKVSDTKERRFYDEVYRTAEKLSALIDLVNKEFHWKLSMPAAPKEEKIVMPIISRPSTGILADFENMYKTESAERKKVEQKLIEANHSITELANWQNAHTTTVQAYEALTKVISSEASNDRKISELLKKLKAPKLSQSFEDMTGSIAELYAAVSDTQRDNMKYLKNIVTVLEKYAINKQTLASMLTQTTQAFEKSKALDIFMESANKTLEQLPFIAEITKQWESIVDDVKLYEYKDDKFDLAEIKTAKSKLVDAARILKRYYHQGRIQEKYLMKLEETFEKTQRAVEGINIDNHHARKVTLERIIGELSAENQKIQNLPTWAGGFEKLLTGYCNIKTEQNAFFAEFDNTLKNVKKMMEDSTPLTQDSVIKEAHKTIEGLASKHTALKEKGILPDLPIYLLFGSQTHSTKHRHFWNYLQKEMNKIEVEVSKWGEGAKNKLSQAQKQEFYGWLFKVVFQTKDFTSHLGNEDIGRYQWIEKRLENPQASTEALMDSTYKMERGADKNTIFLSVVRNEAKDWGITHLDTLVDGYYISDELLKP